MDKEKDYGISNETPLYVIKLDNIKNELIVGEEKDIFTNELYAEDLNYTVDINLEKPINIKAKIRYSAKEAEAVLEKVDEKTVKVTFKEAQRAITRGQSVVFYIDDIVIGGGKII